MTIITFSKEEIIESIAKTYVYSPYLDAEEPTSVWRADTHNKGAAGYIVFIGCGASTIHNVIDCEDGINKAAEYFKEFFPRTFKDADWLIFEAGVADALTEEDWNDLFPSIWNQVVEEFRQDISSAWDFMEIYARA